MQKTKKKIYYTSVFEKNLFSKYQTVVNIGGARSSKSHSLAQLLAYKMRTEQNKNFGISRKTMPALKMTAYRVFIDMLKEWGLYNIDQHNRTEHFYDFPLNKNRIQFFSLDDPEKIKSSEFNYIWMEEANEFTYRDYITLLTRLSGKKKENELNQMFLSLNPSDQECWIAKKLLTQNNVELIKSTYKDNPFLDKNYTDILENLKNEDINSYRIYTLGEWGNVEGRIYTKYDFIEKLPEIYSEKFYGLDFGYNVPTALVEILIKDGEVFIDEKLYEPKLINTDLIKILEDLIPDRHCEIFADSAAAADIEEISRAGFNIHPSNKDVKAGIKFVKKFCLHITKKSDNVIKEIKSYAWKKNKADEKLDEPIKFNDHAMDAIRYALYTKLKDYTADSAGIFASLRI
jgi:phage terminase large subunit